MREESSKNELQKKTRVYQAAIAKFGDSPKALLWKSTESASLRYQELIADIDFENKTILDVGCGFGDILIPISEKTSNFHYTGIDMTPECIKIAKKKYPHQTFLVGDYLIKPLRKQYDIILCSGALNSYFNNVYEFRKSAIKVMFHHCKETLAFNMAGSYPQPSNTTGARVYYADALKILAYCLSLSHKFIWRNHYHPKDFTIILCK
jgi:SAM-dependent methyltransferase